jgi:hypothetical protein
MVFYSMSLQIRTATFPPAAILLSLVVIMATTTSSVQAETGKGTDIFKVIMTIFGVDKSKGDIAAIVTVNNGEASKVKFLPVDPSTINSTPVEGIIEYVATFPNITVNTGDEYQACVLPVKTLELICTTGNNSPATRPEFVDLSLNTTSEVGQVTMEDDEGEE